MHTPEHSPLFSRDVNLGATQRLHELSRRQVLQAAGAAAVGAAAGLPSAGAWAAGWARGQKR